jgi:two-component system CitB family sensor kinase
LKIHFSIDEESSFKDVPDSLNRDALITIFGNLLNNAFEAVREKEDGDKKVSLFLTDLGKELIIEVEDNGPGIDEEHFESIFQQGFSTKSGDKNAGIGLSLVRQALKKVGGTITFSSKKGEGTAFTVAIPKSRGYDDESSH